MQEFKHDKWVKKKQPSSHLIQEMESHLDI